MVDSIKDCCVLCGVETTYDRDTHIAHRKCYIDGSGQLCEPCFKKTYGEDACPDPVTEADLKLPCPICGTPATETLRGPVITNWSCAACGHEFET